LTNSKPEIIINKIEEENFYYHPIYTIIAFIFSLLFFLTFIYILNLCWKTSNKLFYGTLIFGLLFSNPFYTIFIAFKRLMTNKPAITLTNKYLFDNWNNLKINWNDINKISSLNIRWSFLCFNTTTNKIVFGQIYDPSKYFFMRLEKLLSGKSFKINLSLIKGDNSKISSRVNYFWNRNK
jgi:hypothetical protein